MFVNYRYFSLCSFIFIISFLSSTASFCSELSSTGDADAACFLEKPRKDPLVLRTSGNSLVLPCHVARSKRATVEWWYTDLRNSPPIKIYPIYPPVRPTVLRFVTSLTPFSKHLNETDILDASILLRNINVDDSGIYRCVIRPWSIDPLEQVENILFSDDATLPTLNYQVQDTAPRLCQSSPGALPCFTAMRTSSPTVIDAYQTAFLQCVIKNQNLPVNVFWVVGDASVNSVLITDHLSTNHYHGEALRRVFPLSPIDYSLELTVNHTIPSRVYSCVIDGATDVETTLFTYIVRTINLEDVHKHPLNKTRPVQVIPAHDTLNAEQINLLRDSKKVPKDEERKTEVNKTEGEDSTTTTTTTTTPAV